MGQRGGHLGDDMGAQCLVAGVVGLSEQVGAGLVGDLVGLGRDRLDERDLPDLIADLVGGAGHVDAEDQCCVVGHATASRTSMRRLAATGGISSFEACVR
jgi:hypothetical protein